MVSLVLFKTMQGMVLNLAENDRWFSFGFGSALGVKHTKAKPIDLGALQLPMLLGYRQ